MAVPLSWGAPLPESPPPSLTLPPEVSGQLKAACTEDFDIFGEGEREARRKERHDSDFEMFRQINDEGSRARAHTEHLPSPSPTPPSLPPSQPAPQPQPQLQCQPQPQPPSQSVPPLSSFNKRKRLAEDAEEEYRTVRADDHLTETPPTNIRKCQWRGLESMDRGIRREVTGKCTLADVDEEKDHTAQEPGWMASKSLGSGSTDLNEQDLCGSGGSTQVPTKRITRQAKTSKRSRSRVPTDEAETRQEQGAERRPCTRSTRQKPLVSLHPTKKGTVLCRRP